MKFVHHNGFKVVDIRSAGNKKVSALTVREFNTIKKFALNRKTAVPIALATIFFDTEYPKKITYPNITGIGLDKRILAIRVFQGHRNLPKESKYITVALNLYEYRPSPKLLIDDKEILVLNAHPIND